MHSGGPKTTFGVVKHTVEKMLETYVKFDSFKYENLRYNDHYRGKSENDWRKDIKSADYGFPQDIKYLEANAILERLIAEKGIQTKPSVNELNSFNHLAQEEAMVMLYKCDTRNYFFKLNDFINDKSLSETGKNELIQRQQYIVNNWVLGKIGLFGTPTVFEEFKQNLAKFVLDKQNANESSQPSKIPQENVLKNQTQLNHVKTRRRYTGMKGPVRNERIL